ncbi:methyltransferase domain-containing protein [bacterium]|nr:methyltransferase domain-containing protein [bacterium]
MPITEPFDRYLPEYEQWFERNRRLFLSEVATLKKILPLPGRGVEIGIGSGLFAVELGITEGIDPSPAMRAKAAERGLRVLDGTAENLPWEDGALDYALMVTTVCFLDDVELAFREAARVLKAGGRLIIGFVDRSSQIGRMYQLKKSKSRFYGDAEFYTPAEIASILARAGFTVIRTLQTLFGNPKDMHTVQEPKPGYGEGGFIVIDAKRS